MASAVMPFESVAKHAFKVLALPILSSRICMLRVETREDAKSFSALGPEITSEGSVQELDEVEADESEEEAGGDGGPPMIPPSRKETGTGRGGGSSASAFPFDRKESALERESRRGTGDAGGSESSLNKVLIFRVVVGEMAFKSM